MKEPISKEIKAAKSLLAKKNTFILGENWYGIRNLFLPEVWKKKRLGFKKYKVFAEDDCGNEYLIDNKNRIFFWDHETDKATKISESIFSFLSLLQEQPEVELKPEQVISVWVDPDFKPEFD
ncbi:MAG: SMI1/KNR4 family protein [Desulfobacteraceae bacterium]|nr:SMI1/KNR4 family protein [Desulfobacteraceae bacterium]